MEYKVYENTKTKEQVYEEDAQEYALDQLGIKIQPKGKNGEYTTEQFELIETIIEWYFSGNWVEEIIQDEYEQDYEAILEDKKYEEMYK